jgi:polyhydroxyalkanoate synthesis regulator phasin
MPKKKPGMTSEEQSEKFREKVRELIDAGELNPTEADAAFERLMGNLHQAEKPG